MRIAKIPAEIVEAKVLESLRSRMDPATRRVYPRWKLMMREIGVCRQRIADAVNSLKAQGVFAAGTEEIHRGKRTVYVCYYEFPLGSCGDLTARAMASRVRMVRPGIRPRRRWWSRR